MENVENKKRQGRPVVADSARQQKLAAKAELIANGGSLKRGRPTAQNSKRQVKIAEREARIAAGIEPKRGRPKMVKAEVAA